MKKLLSSSIFLALAIVTFCSNGWMAMFDMAEAHPGHQIECCDYETTVHHSDEVDAVIPFIKVLASATVLGFVTLCIILFRSSKLSDSSFLPFFFRRFSRGVFQLE